MNIWIGIDGYLIQSFKIPLIVSLLSVIHMAEDINVIMRPQVTYVNFFKHACYFLNIMYIFTLANISC